ncbi:MAG: hypothetical protein KDD47_06230 [Acidobacteria bacterium]|nr:hypothetical protein [Acidobacteriota bacterium]
MSAAAHPLFSGEDLEKIRLATQRAEGSTSGEVVSYCVSRSDEYPEATLKACGLGALLAVVVAAGWHAWGGFWGADILWILAPPPLGAVAGWLAARSASLRRLLVDEDIMERRVGLRAESAFLEEEVFKTRDRTGVLLFLSLFEHKVVVLADEGIHRQVEASEWTSISSRLARGIRDGRAAEALIEAIGACGDLLERRRVERREDDVNELADELRIRRD